MFISIISIDIHYQDKNCVILLLSIVEVFSVIMLISLYFVTSLYKVHQYYSEHEFTYCKVSIVYESLTLFNQIYF